MAANISERDVVEDPDERGRAFIGAATSWRAAGISSVGDAGERGGGLIGARRWVSHPLAVQILLTHPERTVPEGLRPVLARALSTLGPKADDAFALLQRAGWDSLRAVPVALEGGEPSTEGTADRE